MDIRQQAKDFNNEDQPPSSSMSPPRSEMRTEIGSPTKYTSAALKMGKRVADLSATAVNLASTAKRSQSTQGALILTHRPRPNKYEAFVRVKGPSGEFNGYLLFNSSLEDELKIPQQKAQQLGILAVLNLGFHGIYDDALKGIVNRVSPTVVELFLNQDRPQCKAQLEVSTIDGSPVPTTSEGAAPVTVEIHTQSRFTPLEGDKEGCSHDIIIGRIGMMKLGLRIETRCHQLCRFKRMVRA